MRVLWFVDKPMPAVTQRQARPPINHAGWQYQLEAALRHVPDLTLGVASLSSRGYAPYEPFASDGTTYYGIPGDGNSSAFKRVARRWQRVIGGSDSLDCAHQIMSAFRPDLVHVHGTESRFSLLAGHSQVPVVISIQGVLSVIELMDRRGVDTSLLLSISPGLFIRGTGAILDYEALKKSASQERLVVRQCRHFIGRTRFDADVISVLNPGAHYYHCDEPLRPEFRASVWNQDRCEPLTIYCTMGGYARKGLGTLLRATALLRDGPVPGVRLRFAGLALDGSEGGRAAAREIRRLGLSQCVTSLGALDPDGLARELLRASVFALPTHIDNGSNSLSEAMSVGVPCVASAAGGIPTTARDEVEALLVQDGDPYALAGAILRLLKDKEMASRLSQQARRVALARHDPERIRKTVVDIYQSVLNHEAVWHATER